jgi:hypothetical protein
MMDQHTITLRGRFENLNDHLRVHRTGIWESLPVVITSIYSSK